MIMTVFMNTEGGDSMIIIRMSGGLERQMFQYALYMKLTAMGREVKFDDINEYRDDRAKPIMLSVFGLSYPRATWKEINVFTDGSTQLLDGRKFQPPTLYRAMRTKMTPEPPQRCLSPSWWFEGYSPKKLKIWSRLTGL